MTHIIQSAGGIVYFIHQDGQPRYLLLKRQARSKKIERVAPKGKMQVGETMEQAAVREVSEETGIPVNTLLLGQKIGVMSLRNTERREGMMDKDMTFYLMKYSGDPQKVIVLDGEGYTGMFKRATLQEVLELIYYVDMRELIRSGHKIILQRKKQDSIKNDFIKNIDM